MIRVSKLRNICSGYRAIEGRDSKKEVRIQMTDADYEMLDVMDMETLLASDINMRMGIADSGAYAVTGNWWDNSGRLVKE